MTENQQKPDLDELLKGDFIDCASPESFHGESNPLTEKVLYAAHARLEYMTPPLYSPNQIFCGCRNSDHFTEHGVQYLQTPEGEYHLPSLLKSRGLEPPHVFIAHVDATRKNMPRGLNELSCFKVMILGDTHHLLTPLQSVLSYFLLEDYDLYIADCKLNHAHFFQALKPDAPIIFFPGFRNRFEARTFIEDKKPLVNFVGKIDPNIHPYRNAMLESLRSASFPKLFEGAYQRQAAAIYANSLISLNFTLNNEFNMRVMEVIAAGGFLLTERIAPQTGLPTCFVEGMHYVSFESIKDCQEKINHFLAHPLEAVSIARAAFDVYRSRFAMNHRRAFFREKLRSHIFSVNQTAIRDRSIPTEMRKLLEAYEHLQALNLRGPHKVQIMGPMAKTLGYWAQDLLRLEVHVTGSRLDLNSNANDGLTETIFASEQGKTYVYSLQEAL